MVAFRGRRRPLPLLLAVGLALSWQAVARAGGNDLNLLNLCSTVGGTNSCLDPSSPDYNNTQSRYRSLMSELGVVVAPRLQTPADTLGYAGFQFSAELGITTINDRRTVNGDASGIPYWDGIEAVHADARASTTPPSSLTTVGGFVRKGLWFPLPAFEFGAGAINILGSRMYAIQGYAKIALQEGFHGWVLPSFAVRGSASQLLGTSQVDLNVFGVDVLVSKAFGIAGTSRIEPYLGWNVAVHRRPQRGHRRHAPVRRLRAAPGDARRSRRPADAPSPPTTAAGTISTTTSRSSPKTSSPATGSMAGFKLKLSVLFMVAEYDFIQAGTSRDSGSDIADSSGSPESFSLSAGLDF